MPTLLDLLKNRQQNQAPSPLSNIVNPVPGVSAEQYFKPGTYEQYLAEQGGMYAPDVAAAFGATDKQLKEYEADVAKAKGMAGGLRLQDLAPSYTAFDKLYQPLKSYTGVMPYEQAKYSFADTYAEKAPQDYEKTQFDFANKYQAPEEYQAAQYNFADQYAPEEYKAAQFDYANQYVAPEEYQAAKYNMPEIEGIEKVQPIAEDIWAGRETSEREKIAQQFADTRERVKQAAIQGQMRPEQLAAIEANLGVEESKALTGAQRDIDFERAKQGVGIAQTEQALKATRGGQQAALDIRSQELQAQEMAKKYGLDIDEARYRVQQQASQQTEQAGETAKAYGLNIANQQFKTQQVAAQQEAQAQEMAKKYGLDIDAARYTVQQQAAQEEAQAKENQAKYGLDLQSAKELATQQAAQQTAQAGELKAGQEWAKGERATAMGVEQAQREAEAAEREKQWQSEYTKSQDVNQQDMAEWQAKNAAYMDYLNAKLQAEQAASQTAAQKGTIWSNMNQQQQEARATEMGGWKTGKAQYEASKPQTTSPVKTPATIGYKAPGQVTSRAPTAKTGVTYG